MNNVVAGRVESLHCFFNKKSERSSAVSEIRSTEELNLFQPSVAYHIETSQSKGKITKQKSCLAL